MATHSKRVKFVPLVGVLSLLVVGGIGGYALAGSSRTPQTVSFADEAGTTATGQNMTVYACLASGKLTHVSLTSPRCPARSMHVQWAAQGAAPAGGSAGQPSSSASPSPSPSASTSGPASPASPSPSPSPSPSGSSTSTGSGPACTTSANDGNCGPYDYAGISNSNGYNTYVSQDIWNPISGASQTLTAHSPGDWSVSANMPASNGAVVSYPDVQQLFTTVNDTPDPLSSFKSITSSFNESGPGSGGGDDYEAAYDIWAGTGDQNGTQEIMIWVDNHGQTPAGSQVGTTTIDGTAYDVWSSGKDGTVSLVLASNETSGTVNVLADLNWLESNGYMPAGSGLNQIDFGWEICSTGGVAKTFTMNQYSLDAS
jgi:hypothetical protein